MQASAAAELQHLLTVPPTGFQGSTNNLAAVAHAALQALRDSGDPTFLFLRTVLELHHDPSKEELLFHCVTGCRHVVLHKWFSYSSAFRSLVRDFFMALGHQPALPRTVRIACYSTCASFWKRQWNDTEPQNVDNPVRPEEQALMEAMKHQLPGMPHLSSPKDLFRYVETIILQPSSNQVASAATFLSVLVGEFMGKSAVQYHLPLEFHKRAHNSFECDGWLDQCLKLSMGALSHVVSVITENPTSFDQDLAMAVVQLTIDVISWEFGTDAWEGCVPHHTSSGRTLLRPPVSWGDYLIRPDFCGAIFHVHDMVSTSNPKLAHALRQLLLLLASLSGPVFVEQSQRFSFATYLVDGTLKLLSSSVSEEKQQQESSELLDVLAMVSRLIANFKLSILVRLPTLVPLLSAITSTGTALLQANAAECERVRGDIDSMEHGEWREEALAIVFDGAVLLCGDPWLLFAGTEESRKSAQDALSNSLAPLYTSYLTCRTRMAKMEELYLTANAADLDEVREEISALNLEEEMTSAAAIGRLHLSASLACLSSLLQPILPQLQALWEQPSARSVQITPENAALLEEARLLTMCVSHLLTDDNEGESPVIPESVVRSCDGDDATTNAITSMVQSLLSLAELQASKIAIDPSNPLLSPLLAKSFLWFLNRWAPAYILPSDYGVSAGNVNGKSGILTVWASPESSQQVVSFCITLCLHYQCYWPLEGQVQEGSSLLLSSLAKRGKQMRRLMLASPSFQQLIALHCLTAGMRHNAPPSELEAAVQAKGSAAPCASMVRGYQRLPYDEKARILTVLLVTSSETENETAKAVLNECLGAVHSAFSSLVQALASKQISSEDVNAREMTCLCVEMYVGVARASEMSESDRIPQFITPSLPHLSGLMMYYAQDLTVCESLLRLFRDYAEQFVAMLNREQCLALFNASAELLRSYSTHHCSTRVVKRTVSSTLVADAEEEQSYSDVLCAIQLLIHLGTKDFLDICSSATEAGVDSSQVTDIIFFGLQQIIPLMTQGLLQFPTLCTQYFSLVGFMMDTYPEKVCVLPYELFDAQLESLLFGMSHMDPFVSRSSLRGIAGITREHLKTNCLAQHLSTHPDVLDHCSRRLLQEVIFQQIVWDRVEPAGMALLPLAAVDINRFVAVVNGLTQQMSPEHQSRLQSAFQTLIQPEVVAKVASGGYEGRMNRVRFKKDFDVFVRDIHSFLVLK